MVGGGKEGAPGRVGIITTADGSGPGLIQLWNNYLASVNLLNLLIHKMRVVIIAED